MMKDIRHSIVDDTDTGRVFHEQTTMKRATCSSINVDGKKDADKFNSKYKYSMRNARGNEQYEKEIVIRNIL